MLVKIVGLVVTSVDILGPGLALILIHKISLDTVCSAHEGGYGVSNRKPVILSLLSAANYSSFGELALALSRKFEMHWNKLERRHSKNLGDKKAKSLDCIASMALCL